MISAVIITKNEAKYITETIRALVPIVHEILVLDSGSTDGTQQLATQAGAQVIETAWLGYGATKNYGHSLAKNDWILSIDADEVVDSTLAKSILKIKDTDKDIVYKIKRVTSYCGKIISNGTFKAEYIPRLFHKETNYWNNELVHETLISKNPLYKTLKGNLIHYTIATTEEHDNKIEKYATMAATQMFEKKKKVTFVQLYINPTIKFLKDYYWNAGFLEGKMGYIIAKKSAYATYLKYKKLKDLHAHHNY